MSSFITQLDRLAQASSPAEYIQVQRDCLLVASADEALMIAQDPNSGSFRRRDCLQILYWLTPPNERVTRFRQLYFDSTETEREIIKSLLFRATTEETIQEMHPDRLDRYLVHLKDEYAKSIFVS